MKKEAKDMKERRVGRGKKDGFEEGGINVVLIL